MFEQLWDMFGEDVLYYGLAAACWAISVVFPFRRLESRPEIWWDVVGVGATILFASAATLLLSAATGWLYDNAAFARWHAIVARWHWLPTVAVYVLLADCGAYWAHRALHGRMLWAQHAWHHSPKYLYWASGLRGSFLDTLTLFLPYTLAYLVLPQPETGIAAVLVLILDSANQHYIHSNIRLPFARQLERIFVTPRYHFVHHSARREFGNSNYGFVFTFWDRLFGTYTDPSTVPAGDPLGVNDAAANWRLLIGLPAKSQSSIDVAALAAKRTPQ